MYTLLLKDAPFAFKIALGVFYHKRLDENKTCNEELSSGYANGADFSTNCTYFSTIYSTSFLKTSSTLNTLVTKKASKENTPLLHYSSFIQSSV